MNEFAAGCFLGVGDAAQAALGAGVRGNLAIDWQGLAEKLDERVTERPAKGHAVVRVPLSGGGAIKNQELAVAAGRQVARAEDDVVSMPWVEGFPRSLEELKKLFGHGPLPFGDYQANHSPVSRRAATRLLGFH